MEKMIRVRWEKSAIGKPSYQKETLKGLGFRRLRQTLTLPDRPEIRGMIKCVSHLLEVME
ncbi:MAG: 50S ribosomal protein L30 [Deltaproteobacteria bacterium RBG_16_47_11]|nr:MAG: 50S ribosomal protein L30 [Deltaproteobacteria bacterium RBG_16_47_11]